MSIQNLSEEDQKIVIYLLVDEYLLKDFDIANYPISLREYSILKKQFFLDLDNYLLNRNANYEFLQNKYTVNLIKLIERNRSEMVKRCINRQLSNESGINVVEDFNWSIIKTHSSNASMNYNDHLIRQEFSFRNSINNGELEKKVIELKKEDFRQFQGVMEAELVEE